MTDLADKQQALPRTVGISGMAAHRASLARVVGVYLDRSTAMQECFIGEHAVQLCKTPFGMGGVGFPLLFAHSLAFAPSQTFADIGQVFQSDQAVGITDHDVCRDDMIGVKRAFSYRVVFARVQRVLLQRGEYSLAQPIQLALS